MNLLRPPSTGSLSGPRGTRRGLRTAGLGVLLCAAIVPTALASGFQIRESSVVGLGSAFSGTVTANDDPAVATVNPAAMVLLGGTQISLGITGVLPSAQFSGSAHNAFGQPISDQSPGSSNTSTVNRNAGDSALVPNAYAVFALSPSLRLGLSATVPYGLSTDYGAGWVGRYQAETSLLQTIDLNVALAWRLTPWLAVGGGISAQYANADLSSAINSTTAAFGATGQLLPLPDGNLTIKGHDWGAGWNVGILLQPNSGTRIGLAYHARVRQVLQGSADFAVPYPLTGAPGLTTTRANAALTLPDNAAIGIAQRLTSALSAMASLTWTDWRLFQQLRIDAINGPPVGTTIENWHNSFSVAAGLRYVVSPVIALSTGTGFDQSPVPDATRTARIPDSDRVWLSAGISYRLGPHLTIDASYAHLFGGTASINEASPTADLLTGQYHNHVDLVALGARTQF